MKQHSATFANFICRFGDKNLLDYAKEIVIPAFTRDTYIRSYGKKTHYHFYEVDLLNLAKETEAPILILSGRFIKDTELTREQIFDDDKGLIKDARSMRSSPSAFFILILNNHRLIYFSETKHAPDLNSFKSTAQSFLSRRHKEFLEEVFKSQRDTGKPVTKKTIAKKHPWPHLEIVQLADKSNVESLLKRFKKLEKIDFRLVRPNPDIDAGEILSQVRELSDELGSTSTKVTMGDGKEGLDIQASTEAVQEATTSGNQDITIRGKDAVGNRLSATNDSFKLLTEIDNVPPTKKSLIKLLLNKFNVFQQDGTINSDPINKSHQKVEELSENL